jgi:hypothetical protein
MDALFAMRVISELDGIVGADLEVQLGEYQNYDYGGKELCKYVDQLYSIYIKGKVVSR